MDENRLRQWESALQTDMALRTRLQRLNPKGYAATRKGDLLELKLAGAGKPIVVNWDGDQICVGRRQATNPFLSWRLGADKFNELFLSGKNPPVLVAMNNDQKNIAAGADHHNGSLVISFMVMLQECAEGGGAA